MGSGKAMGLWPAAEVSSDAPLIYDVSCMTLVCDLIMGECNNKVEVAASVYQLFLLGNRHSFYIL